MTAAEIHNPTKIIPTAIRGVWVRILLFYILGVFMLGLICPSNDPNLVTGTGNAASSAWVIGIQRAGIKVLPHIANACFLSTCPVFPSSRDVLCLTLNGCSFFLVCKLLRFVHILPRLVRPCQDRTGPENLLPYQRQRNPCLRSGRLRWS